MLRLLRPLHFKELPYAVHAVVAPLQSLHLRALREQLKDQDHEQIASSLRPVLLPRERWGDTHAWKHNLHFLGWLRLLYLGSLPATRALLPGARSALQQGLNGPPSMACVRKHLDVSLPDGRALCGSSLSRAQERQRQQHEHDAAAPTSSPHDCDQSTAAISLEDVLEGCGAMVARRGALAVYCEEQGIYQLLTAEMVGALADYLVSRLPSLQPADGAPVWLLAEAEGGGTGRGLRGTWGEGRGSAPHGGGRCRGDGDELRSMCSLTI